jgi:hypothetical protein
MSTIKVMNCDRRVVGESDMDYEERLEYNIQVPYDSYIEGRAGFLCGIGEMFDGDDSVDIMEYLREERAEEIYDGVAIIDKQIDDPGYETVGLGRFAIPFMYMAATEYVETEQRV